MNFWKTFRSIQIVTSFKHIFNSCHQKFCILSSGPYLPHFKILWWGVNQVSKCLSDSHFGSSQNWYYILPLTKYIIQWCMPSPHRTSKSIQRHVGTTNKNLNEPMLLLHIPHENKEGDEGKKSWQGKYKVMGMLNNPNLSLILSKEYFWNTMMCFKKYYHGKKASNEKVSEWWFTAKAWRTSDQPLH